MDALDPDAVRADVGWALDTLETFAPGAPRRAAAVLNVLLDRWCATADGPYHGRLTGGGFPVELVFTTGEPAVRYTSEVAGPAVPPAARLQTLADLPLGVDTSRPLLCEQIQQGAPLSWGAWLGGRHTAWADAYKTYVEAASPVGADARAALGDALGRHATLLDSRVLQLRMVAWEPAASRLELYFRTDRVEPRELSGLLRFAGFADREGDLRRLLTAGRNGKSERLAGAQHGISIALGASGIEAFTLCAFATSVFGDDAAVREGLLSIAASRGWDLESYAAISAPLARRHSARAHHGMLSWIVPRDRPLRLAVGLRPSRGDVADAP